ncbi:MAG: hypothetical protein HFJ48_04735 [Clostridia bacterium]|nr:hypothetical protein [Clostridia bacterium]
MKNGLKYIFFIFVIIIVIFAIFQIRKTEKVEKEPEEIVEEEKVKQELKLGIAEYDTINPLISNNKYVQDISKLIYEPLITINPKYELEGCLAEEWAKTSNTTYIVKLKQNIIWTNEENFTVYDVIYTIQKLKEINSIYTPNVQNIEQVEAIDNYTLKITLNQEIPFFEYNLTFPIMNRTYCGDEDFINSEKIKQAIGTGEYKINNITGNTILLDKNEKWWNKEEKGSTIETININLYTTVGEIYNDFKLGKIDYISTNNVNIEEYIGTIGYNKVEAPGREYEYIAFNLENQVLQNKEVRQAIMHAIDKQSIIDSLYKSKYYKSNFPLDYGNWIYEQNNENTYNIDKFYQVLQDNEWKYEYNNWQRYINYSTKRLNFRILVNKENVQRTQVAEIIKQQLEAVGIKITIIYASSSQYENYINYKNYDIVLCGSYVGPNIDLTKYFEDGNISNYNNEEIKSIIKEVQNITDSQLLKEKYKRISEIYMDDVPYISLYNSYSIVACSKNLVGRMTANWFNTFYDISTWRKR